MTYWDSMDSIGVILDSSLFIIAALVSFFLWITIRSLLKRRGTRCRTSVRNVTSAGCIGLLALGEGVAWFVFSNIDLPLPYTVYAESYTRSKFNNIRIGDSEEHLFELIGKPLRLSEEGGIDVLFYSTARQGTMGSYWQRIVFVDRTTRTVNGKLATFYTGL